MVRKKKQADCKESDQSNVESLARVRATVREKDSGLGNAHVECLSVLLFRAIAMLL